MSDQRPTIGRIVHYMLSEVDVAEIETKVPQYRTGTNPSGDEYSVYQRNSVHTGQVFPAVVVAVSGSSTATVNLMVQLDGYGQYWATSRVEGDKPGNWSWPSKD